ncbi:MAG TPA: hypothetical protein VFH77_01880 [Streptomyces sp.]|nr:hypothetical protein [Streptomyces sp.]
MLWEASVSALLGLLAAWAAVRALPGRLPRPSLVLPTGVVGALAGDLIAHAVLGAGHPAATLAIGLGVCAALLSLLLGERRRPAGLTVAVSARPAARTTSRA